MISSAVPEPSMSLGPWPQYQAGPEYGYVHVNNDGLLPYNAQPHGTELIQRQLMPVQYPVNNFYDTPVDNPHLRTGLGSPLGTSMIKPAPFEPQWIPPAIATTPPSLVQQSAAPQGAGAFSAGNIKADTQASLTRVKHRSPSSSPVAALKTAPKTDSKIATPRPRNAVDSVLAVIQTKPAVTDVISKTTMLSAADGQASNKKGLDEPVRSAAWPSQTAGAGVIAGRRRRAPAVKRHCCDWDGCGARFAHKAQLVSHIRSHTGEKPYPCGVPGCDSWFSQTGNRKTHWMGHKGIKPFPCRFCGRCFTSKGNVKPHEATHEKKKPWVCILENCQKKFTIKGNMKGHQVKYHKAKLAELEERFSKVGDPSELDTEEDRYLWRYLADVHDHANKGIKGCRGSRIRRLAAPPSSPEFSPPTTPSSTNSHHSSPTAEFSAPSTPSPCYNSSYYLPFVGQWHDRPVNTCYMANYRNPYDLGGHIISPDAEMHVGLVMYGGSNCHGIPSPTSTATYDDEEEQKGVWDRRVWY